MHAWYLWSQRPWAVEVLVSVFSYYVLCIKFMQACYLKFQVLLHSTVSKLNLFSLSVVFEGPLKKGAH